MSDFDEAQEPDADQLRDLRSWAVEQVMEFVVSKAAPAYALYDATGKFPTKAVVQMADSLVRFVIDGTVPAT